MVSVCPPSCHVSVHADEARYIEIFGLLNKYLKHKLVTIFDLDQTNNNRMRQFNFWGSINSRYIQNRIDTQT